MGVPAGKIATYVEVPFKVGGKSVRPDGVIGVSRGGKEWVALVEAKSAANPLDSRQVDAYIDLAREVGFDAVLTISN